MPLVPNQGYSQIAEEVGEALECARAGKPHPRLGNLFDRTIDEMERRAVQRQQVVRGGIMSPRKETTTVMEEKNGYLETGGLGPGGAIRSD